MSRANLSAATFRELDEAKYVRTSHGAYVGRPMDGYITLDGQFTIDELIKLTAFLAWANGCDES